MECDDSHDLPCGHQRAAPSPDSPPIFLNGTLFELFLEFFKLPAQAFDFGRKRFNSVFKTNDFFGFDRSARLFADRLLAVGIFDLHFSSQQMRKAGLLLTGLARQLDHQGLGVFRAQRVKSLFDFFQSGDLIQPVRAPANLTGGLRTAEHQHAHHGQLWRAQMKIFRHMFVLRHATGAAKENVGQILLAQAVERLLNFLFRKRADRTAIVLLIAGQRQSVEGQRIVLRRRDLLFD